MSGRQELINDGQVPDMLGRGLVSSLSSDTQISQRGVVVPSYLRLLTYHLRPFNSEWLEFAAREAGALNISPDSFESLKSTAEDEVDEAIERAVKAGYAIRVLEERAGYPPIEPKTAKAMK